MSKEEKIKLLEVCKKETIFFFAKQIGCLQ